VYPGNTVIPEGASLTALRPDVALREDYAHLMQRGDWDEIGRLYHSNADAGKLAFQDGIVYNVGARETFEGVQTYLPGHPEVPYHVVGPPGGLTVYENAGSVARPTAVQEFVTEGSGNTVLSACTVIVSCQ
jgi:hypothetical protein